MAKTQSPTSIMFNVNRSSPELVVPAKPTPHEFKSLSDLDNSFRMQFSILFIYPHNPSMIGNDLVKVMKTAISRALVYYYPLAGRLREDPSGKLVVECTGEGVLFIEADADVTLDQLGYPLAPPFPCFEQFVFDVPGSGDIVNTPLILLQMTKLQCGGLVVGFRANHCMIDGAGLAQFIYAIVEMAKGATSLSVLPTWERRVLDSKSDSSDLQQWRYPTPENINKDLGDSYDLCHRTFFFEQTEITALRRRISQDCSSFEMLAACVWKCRVLALASQPAEEDITRLIWPINVRNKSYHLKVPAGYYGNALVYAVVKSTVKEIIENPLTYVLQLVRNGKEIVPKHPNRSGVNFRASLEAYTVTDLRTEGLEDADFGWGKPVYAGPPFSAPNTICHLAFNHKNGEKGIMVPICLPAKSMEIFEHELNSIFKGLPLSGVDHSVAKSK